jgi:hypothetical protein
LVTAPQNKKRWTCSNRWALLLNPAKRAEIVKSDVGFTDLKALQGSPHYHDGNKSYVFAMLRQMGPPTFFLTNSMADTRWAELLQALVWQARKTNLSREEVLALPWVKRALLVRNDQITCTRYYCMQEETLINTVRKGPRNYWKSDGSFFKGRVST